MAFFRGINQAKVVFLAVLMGFGFYMLNQLFAPLAELFQMRPILGALLPILIFALLAGVLFRRI